MKSAEIAFRLHLARRRHFSILERIFTIRADALYVYYKVHWVKAILDRELLSDSSESYMPHLIFVHQKRDYYFILDPES